MLPPCPPSPPEGPPRGTYFSRRKAMQPLPPSPAFTSILASSTNTGIKLRKSRPAAQWHHRLKAQGKKHAVRPSRTAEKKSGGLNPTQMPPPNKLRSRRPSHPPKDIPTYLHHYILRPSTSPTPSPP